MSDNIPFEIQLEIVKRLPLKAMFRFRLVSKPWNSFIGTSKFISSYNEHHPIPPPRLLARYIDHSNPSEQLCVSIVDDETFTQQRFPPTVNVLTNRLRDIEVVGCSHGLLCFYGFYRDPSSLCYMSPTEMVILWNPLIRKSVGIELPYSGRKNPLVTKIVGFGVCHVTNDPTIVHIKHTNMYAYHSDPWVVQVFTLSSQTWKTLQSTNMPRKTINTQWCQAVVDRFIYWCACERIFVNGTDIEQDVAMIVSFDMTTHEFEVIDLPDSISHNTNFDVTKFRDSLALIEYNLYSEDHVCDIWMMATGAIKSFTKLFTIYAPNAPLRTVHALRKNGELIMETLDYINEFATLVAYNPYLNQIVDLGIYAEFSSLFLSSSYMETPLLLDQTDCHIFSNEPDVLDDNHIA